MTSPTPDTTYDVLVLGAGPAGENVADVAGRDGLRVAIIERDLVGGECSYWGCMPSKALLRPGGALEEISRVPGARRAVTGGIDVADALDRRDAFAGNWDDAGQVKWLEGVGVDLIRGHARLAGERTLEVTARDGSVTRYLASTAVVVATGTHAAVPAVAGLADIGAWDNRDIAKAKDVPPRLLVVGGGAIGVEMAQAWTWLGSDVTLVEASDRLLSREEPIASAELRAALEKTGVHIHTSAVVESVERPAADGPGTATIRLADGSTNTVTADEVLVATGRGPNTADIGLETIGLDAGGFIEVDGHLRVAGVAGDWLYAVGDVNGRSLFTHTGKYQARIAGANIRGFDSTAWGDRRAVPRVVFTSPEIAAVGMTEREARDHGIEVRTVTYDIGHVAAAPIIGRGHHGTALLVIDAQKETIVGATFVGPRVSELLHAATIAIVAETPLSVLWHAVPAFPTLSEVWLRLLEAYRDEYGARFL